MKEYSYKTMEMNDDMNKQKHPLNDHLDMARNAEPVVKLEDVASLIGNKGSLAGRKETGNTRSRNLLRGLLSASIIFLFFIGYLFYRDEPAPPVKNDGTSLSEKSNAPAMPGNVHPEYVAAQPKVEAHEATTPPVRKDENRINPPLETDKKTGESEKAAPVRTRTQTEGDATITFKHGDKNVKMILAFDEMKDLFIDGNRIEPDQYDSYADVIESGKALEQKTHKQKAADSGLTDSEKEQNRQNEIVMQSLVKSLKKDGLIDDQSFDFRLRWNQLLINDVQQPDEVYDKYKTLYEETSGKKLNEKSNVHIRH